MAKILGDNTKSDYKMVLPGIFIEKVKIKDVEDYSNYPLKKGPQKTIGEKGFAPELCLKITTNDDRTVYVFGKFDYKTDLISGKKIEYRGWKRNGNGVWSLLYTLLGEFPINDDDSIPESLLNKLKNKSFYRLRYCTGLDTNNNQPVMKDYNKYSDAEKIKADEILLEVFQNDKYFYSKYDRNAYENYMEIMRTKQAGFNPSDFEGSGSERSSAEDDII
jgi:hypothetical protein